MKGTFQYSRTRDAIEWLKAGDIIQNIETDEYFKMRKGKVFISDDSFHWVRFTNPIQVYPPYMEWRSLSNLHYYEDLKNELGDETICYLSDEMEVFEENDKRADKKQKRWFVKSMVEL